MKKLIFSLSLFLSFSSFVHAQWTTNGTVTSTTNSIGIGTTTPDEKLVVNGNIKSVLESTYNPTKNVVTIKQLGLSGATGAMNWTLRGVYQYPNGVLSNADGGDLDIIKSWNGNTILGTKTDGTPLGNVGIGTQTPGLTNSAFKTLTLSGLNTRSVIELQNTSAGTSGIVGSLEFYNGSTAIAGIDVGADGATNSGAYQFYTFNNGSIVPAVKILSNGNMGIGITNPQNKLDVNGRIHSQSVLIDMNGWSDYVFKKDYKLPSLSDVKNYIDQNQHLPEIPSEQQITKDGLNLGEMNKLLMKKVEELTLYMIEEYEGKKEQEQTNKQLKEQVAALRIQMEALSKILSLKEK